jgi:hypothetical protein
MTIDVRLLKLPSAESSSRLPELMQAFVPTALSKDGEGFRAPRRPAWGGV